MRNKAFEIIFIILTILFSGCNHYTNKIEFAMLSPEKKTFSNEKEKALARRYLEYWDLFSRKKFDKAYSFELPHQQFIHDLQWYRNFNEPNDRNYKIILKKIDFLNDYIAVITAEYISSDKETSFVFKDKWFLIKGRWFHVMKTSRLPDIQKLP